MQMGMVGLGRMGANMVRRLMRDGHECVVYDVRRDTVATLEKEGAAGADSLEGFVAKLSPPRAVWVMVPAAFTDQSLDSLADVVEAGDALAGGGSRYYHGVIHPRRGM